MEYIELQSQSVTLQWEELNTTERCNPPILYSVKVEAQQLRCSGQQRIESNTTNTHTIITGLCPYSSYRISVKACTNTVCGEYSSSLLVHTLEDGVCDVYKLLMLYYLKKLLLQFLQMSTILDVTS